MPVLSLRPNLRLNLVSTILWIANKSETKNNLRFETKTWDLRQNLVSGSFMNTGPGFLLCNQEKIKVQQVYTSEITPESGLRN